MQNNAVHSSRLIAPSVTALTAGLVVSAIDNFAAGGEVSPIVIVPMLLLATALLGAVWGQKAAPAAILFWLPMPGAHLVKHILRVPDTIHPNTYASIGMLGIFSLVVCAIGFGLGLGLRRFTRAALSTSGRAKSTSGRAKNQIPISLSVRKK